MCNNSKITCSICMKLAEIIFCWINLPSWYQICIDDVIFTEFLWYWILSNYRFLWKSNDSKWRHFRSILVSTDAEKTTKWRFWLELSELQKVLRFTLTECTLRAVQSTLLSNFQTEKSRKLKELETSKFSSRLILVCRLRWA